MGGVGVAVYEYFLILCVLAQLNPTGIKDVWRFNMNEEFRNIRSLVRRGYNYVAVVSCRHE